MTEAFRARPAVWLCLAAMCGIAAGIDPVMFLCLLLVAVWLRGTQRVICIGAGIFGWLISPGLPVVPLYEKEFLQGNVRVETMPRATANGESVVGTSPLGGLLLTSEGSIGLLPGDIVQVSAVVVPLSEPETPSWVRRGVVGRLRLDAPLEPFQKGPPWYRWAWQVRSSFLEMTGAGFRTPLQSAVDALCFNVEGPLPEGFRDDLRTTGTVHIISASGLHAAVVAFALLAILGRFPVPRFVQLLLLVVLLAVYAMAAGSRPPIVRSVVLVAVLASAYLFRREPDAISTTATTAGAFLVAEPTVLWDIGFQLSFVTVLALSMFGGFVPSASSLLGRGRQWVVTVARTSLVASAASAPLVGYHFGAVPLMSVVSNVLIAGAVGPIVVVSLVASALWPFWPGLATALLQWGVAPFAEWLVGVIDILGKWDWAVLFPPEYGAFWLIAVYAALVSLWRDHPRPCPDEQRVP